MRVSSLVAFVSRAKLDLCLPQIAIAAPFVRGRFCGAFDSVALFSATSLRLTFVDPVHSRGAQSNRRGGRGIQGDDVSSRVRGELSPSFTRRAAP